jgi:AcrR family transcriptional regulator
MKETQGNIIKTAKRLFGKYGLRKTTVDDIAGEARIGKGTIYHYYESKEDIFIAVVEDEVQFLKEEVMKAVASQSAPDKKLRMYILTRMRVIGKVANFYSTFKQEYIDYYGFVNKIHSKYTDFEIGVIKQFIQEGIDSGLFKVDNLDLTAFTIVIAMKGLEYYWAMETDQDLESKLDSMLNVLFMGIFKR